jgi:S-DNA-T family DNA segregation ATPase FtsK/SpoIIIE
MFLILCILLGFLNFFYEKKSMGKSMSKLKAKSQGESSNSQKKSLGRSRSKSSSQSSSAESLKVKIDNKKSHKIQSGVTGKSGGKNSEKNGVDKEFQPHFLSYRLREVVLVFVGALALFLLLALASYHETDSAWSYRSGDLVIQNSAGKIGAYSADMILSFLGFFGFLMPFLLAYGAWVLYHDPSSEILRNKGALLPRNRGGFLVFLARFLGVFLVFVGGSGLSALLLEKLNFALPQGAGGILGELALKESLPVLNLGGSALIFLVSMLLGLTLYSGLRWLEAFISLGRGLMISCRFVFSKVGDFFRQTPRQDFPSSSESLAAPLDSALNLNGEGLIKSPPKSSLNSKLSLKSSLHLGRGSSAELDLGEGSSGNLDLDFDLSGDSLKRGANKLVAKPLAKLSDKPELKVTMPSKPAPLVESVLTTSSELKNQGNIPSIDLLDMPQSKPLEVSEDFLRNLAKLAEEKLNDFGVDAKVVGALPGPVITRFELQLAAGVKANKLTNLSKDLARSLSVHSVRVVEVIPGKSYVGLEIPNETRQTVRLREVLSSRAYLDHPSPLAMGLGLNIQGTPEVVDLQKMPHLLVAGTTGSGKSVGLNAMLLSLLLKSTPEYLRLIMIDPKMLELSIYEGIPHLLAPVVTDMKEAANALRWCVKEMDRRYQLMAAMAVRNIGSYNEKVKEAIDAGTPLLNPLQPEGPIPRDPLACMPYIVVLVDEFADMIMVVGKKVEELIARLAQKARAAGIHLIVATQRPSVDVITGLIKANIPTRMAFQVSSKIDSRTILDQSGAEQLLGYGDMLYLPPGSGHPVRVHGAYVSDQEVQKIVAEWRQHGEPQYHPEVLKSLSEDEDGEKGGGEGSQDELYDQAVQIVLETGRASISAVQRRLRIGYNRAARLIEEMEANGIVSELMPNGMREVLARA